MSVQIINAFVAMQGEAGMSEWITIASALLVPIVAIVGTCIAIFQWSLAAKKRKDELFDRRWDFYCRAKKIFLDELTNTINNQKKDKISRHISLNWTNHYADEAFFLFGEDIEKHIRAFPEQIVESKKVKANRKIIEDPVLTFRKPFKKYLRLKK